MTPRDRRFPIGLTLAAAAVFALCVGLGLWQVQRLHWKQGVLARLAALQSAPAQPIGPVLARAARGETVEFTRVVADCAAAPPAPAVFIMGAQNGEYEWRPQSACRIEAPPFDGVVADRGVMDATRGQTAPTPAVLPAPRRLVGVLRLPAHGLTAVGLGHPAPLVLVVEGETPPAPGITPTPPPNAAPESLQYVGAYAPTWFGLAGVAACFYAAMLWRRVRPT